MSSLSSSLPDTHPLSLNDYYAPVHVVEDEASTDTISVSEEMELSFEDWDKLFRPEKAGKEKTEATKKDKVKEKDWLKALGLKMNPFQVTNAENDGNIPFYLVGNEAFNQISGQTSSFVFAPRGGGKTTFRVRLSLECRSGALSPSTFALNYILPPYYEFLYANNSEELHYEFMSEAAAKQLFLVLAYSPNKFLELNSNVQLKIKSMLQKKLPTFYGEISQVEEHGLRYLINTIDLTMQSIVNTPAPEDVLAFCKKMKILPDLKGQRRSGKQYFTEFVDLLFSELGYKSLFILVDEVDANPETEKNAEKGTQMIEWLLDQTERFESQGIYLKYFLPAEYFGYLKVRYSRLLTHNNKIAKIKWDVESLEEVVYRRLWEASDRRFGSLRAISDKSLRGMEKSPEEMIIEHLVFQSKGIPREVIIKIKEMLHIRCSNLDGVDDKLSKLELQKVLAK